MVDFISKDTAYLGLSNKPAKGSISVMHDGTGEILMYDGEHWINIEDKITIPTTVISNSSNGWDCTVTTAPSTYDWVSVDTPHRYEWQNCPNCGAPFGTRAVCEYCDTMRK